jgi:hypothetical protein
MKNKKIEACLIFVLITVVIFSTMTSFVGSNVTLQKETSPLSKSITFVEKSSGLQIPAKEGGNTEYELADMNNDGNLDVISVGDHGSPFINSPQHGIMVWIGDGEGTWSVQQVGDFGYGGIEAGDLNSDGYLDVVWGIHHNYAPPGSGFGDTLVQHSAMGLVQTGFPGQRVWGRVVKLGGCLNVLLLILIAMVDLILFLNPLATAMGITCMKIMVMGHGHRSGCYQTQITIIC